MSTQQSVTAPRFVCRNSFARYDVVKRSELHYGCYKCANCGGYPAGRQAHRLYRYGIHTDGIQERLDWDRHLFCSITCRNAYYDSEIT